MPKHKKLGIFYFTRHKKEVELLLLLMKPRLQNFIDGIAASLVASVIFTILGSIFMFIIIYALAWITDIPYSIQIASAFAVVILIVLTIFVWQRNRSKPFPSEKYLPNDLKRLQIKRKQFEGEIPLFDGKEKREIIILLEGWIFEAENHLKNYDNQSEVFAKNPNAKREAFLLFRNVVSGQPVDIDSFIESRFGKKFFEQHFDKDFTLGGVRLKIKILKKVIEDLKIDSSINNQS